MVTDEPAFCAAAAAVLTKSPAPIIAPIPNATNEPGVRVRFRLFSDSDASDRSCVIDFLRNKLIKV
ncbi:hypothetical protein D9M68_753800 [compost metagenome]